MLAPSYLSPVEEASAESNCDNGDFVTPVWNQTVERLAKIPAIYDPNESEDDDRGRKARKNKDRDDYEYDFENYDGPEEEWMTWEPNNDLNLLRDDFQNQMLIGNDSIGVLRVNLDHERRTTICVTIETTNNSYDPSADVYLMTTSQYDRYSTSYDIAHGAWGLKEHRDDDDPTSDVPPEWRSFTVAGWHSFRDSHQYENIKEVSFSISLDGPEISSGLFGDSTNQYFNIVIDNTNNSHQNDAVPETMIVAYVSVVSEPRTTILPNWTVSLVCCGLMIGVLVVPLIMNKRYMNAGLSLTSENQQLEKGLVPSLEQDNAD
tara:strand:+ start:4173 stop:5129 length:957 start_codon:yes stop_codon:yes gene_type:complete